MTSYKLAAYTIVFLIGETIWLQDVDCISNDGISFKKLPIYNVDEWYRIVTVRSSIECCFICAHDPACHIANYTWLEFCCQLSNTSRWSINATADGVLDVFVRQDWALVFRGTPGTGIDPFIAYRDAVNVTTDDISCQQITPTDCNLHYRNPIVDDWENQNVSKVKVSFYKNGTEAAYVIFDGVGSTFRSWFMPLLILDASWPDMIGRTFDSFSMAGFNRRFVMNPVLGGACERSSSYAMALINEQLCGVDLHLSYPQFLYSISDTASPMSNASAFEVADCIAFYIK